MIPWDKRVYIVSR
ncbi:Protein of unknown function [Bacillus toyonensis]|nr:Protein of unknown function [Bacillus toyonensis]